MKFIVDENNEGIRADSYLAEVMQDLSRSKIQKLISSSCIKINGNSFKQSYIIRENDEIVINDETISEKYSINKENIPLNIIWEDENMAVVYKPSGMLTHPTTQELSGTLVNALLYKYGSNLSDINGDMRRGIVHRLDRNTSGLIMIAKNNNTHEYLANEMKERKFTKKYLAIVKGNLEKEDFVIDSPIGRHPTIPYKQAIREDGRESISIVHVLKHFKDADLAEITLVTGRTHQIRVHMASIGHPVYNDTLYGFGKMKIKTQEQVLQSYKLEFTQPFSGKRISLEIPPDEKFEKVIKFLSA